MDDPTPNSPLVDFFLRSVPSHFDFLVAEHGMTAPDVDVLDGQWVTLRYRRPDVVVEVSYGDDRDHYLDVTVARAEPGASRLSSYGLSEWLKHLRVENWMVGCAGIWTEEGIDRHARKAATALRDGLPRILAASPEVRQAIDRERAAMDAVSGLPLDQQRTD